MHKKKIALAIAALELTTAAALTQAQQLEEVVVTARKKTESLMDAPLSVAVVSGDRMDELGMTNMEQVAG